MPKVYFRFVSEEVHHNFLTIMTNHFRFWISKLPKNEEILVKNIDDKLKFKTISQNLNQQQLEMLQHFHRFFENVLGSYATYKQHE